MTSTATPFGLRPVQKLGGRMEAESFRSFPISNGYSTSIFYGDPVTFNAGNINKCAYNFSAGGYIGMFAGCKYTDPNSKQPRWSMYWPASTVATDALAFVYDDPWQVFEVQTDGTGAAFTAANLNLNISWANVLSGAGSTTTGLSAGSMSATGVATTNTLQYRIVGISETPNNAWTDTYPILKVIANFGFHNYLAATGV